VTELDTALVRRKLTAIRTNLHYLAQVAELSLDDYRGDRFRLKGAERMLQEIIEAAVDANQHLLAARNEAVGTDYRESFLAAGRAGVIPMTLAERLAPSAGLRDRLVHDYEDIDDAVVLQSFGKALNEFAEYVAAIESFLNSPSPGT
jgi:uncharacterized protein YutE (UPF0331/DUF86 family)